MWAGLWRWEYEISSEVSLLWNSHQRTSGAANAVEREQQCTEPNSRTLSHLVSRINDCTVYKRAAIVTVKCNVSHVHRHFCCNTNGYYQRRSEIKIRIFYNRKKDAHNQNAEKPATKINGKFMARVLYALTVRPYWKIASKKLWVRWDADSAVKCERFVCFEWITVKEESETLRLAAHGKGVAGCGNMSATLSELNVRCCCVWERRRFGGKPSSDSSSECWCNAAESVFRIF